MYIVLTHALIIRKSEINVYAYTIVERITITSLRFVFNKNEYERRKKFVAT